MAALSPNARSVIEEARAGMRPPAGERERLEALLNAQIAATASNPVNHTPAPPGRVGGWRLVTSLAVGVALVGGAVALTQRPKESPSSVAAPVSASAAVQAVAVQASAPAVEAPALLAPEPVRSTKLPVDSPAPAQPQDRLAQEVSLLTRATSDLRAGRAGAALKLLDEHQRKFPNGMLTVERRAVRAQALCTLKRVSEGRAELSHLAPQSPAAGRAKRLCDAAAASVSGAEQ